VENSSHSSEIAKFSGKVYYSILYITLDIDLKYKLKVLTCRVEKGLQLGKNKFKFSSWRELFITQSSLMKER